MMNKPPKNVTSNGRFIHSLLLLCRLKLGPREPPLYPCTPSSGHVDAFASLHCVTHRPANILRKAHIPTRCHKFTRDRLAVEFIPRQQNWRNTSWQKLFAR